MFRGPRPQAGILTANGDVELGDGGKAGPPRVDFQVGEEMPRNLRGRWNYSRDGWSKLSCEKERIAVGAEGERVASGKMGRRGRWRRKAISLLEESVWSVVGAGSAGRMEMEMEIDARERRRQNQSQRASEPVSPSPG